MVRNVLLAIIAVALVVIAAVLVIDLRERDRTPAWEDAREAAEERAREECSIGGTVDPPASCVEEKAKSFLKEWEQAHPDRVWD